MGNPVVHFEIGCRDASETAAFYERCFGWATADYGPSGKAIATGADTGIQGHITALGHEPHNYVMVYIEVPDVAAAAETVVANGGTLLIGPLAIPNDGRTFAWISDPAGNTIGLIEPASAA